MLGAFLVEQLFFPENERNDPIVSKKTNASNAFLKFLKRLVKERNGMERELIEKNG